MKPLGTVIYTIKKADSFVYGKEGFVVETAQPLGKFFTHKKSALNWCEKTAKMFRVEYTINDKT